MATHIHDIPGAHQATKTLRAHAAATATEKAVIFVAPFRCKVRSVRVVWDAAITGANTNTTHVNLLNGGADGSGTTELATIDYVSGTNAVALADNTLYAPATYLELAAGARLVIQWEKISTGLDIPAGTAVIAYEGA